MDSTNTTNEKHNGSDMPELETKKDEPKEPAAVKKGPTAEEPAALKKEAPAKKAAVSTKKKDPQDTDGAPAAIKKAKKPKSPSKPTTKKRKSSKDDKQSSSSSKGKKESSSKESSSKRAKKGDGGSKKKPAAASKKKSTTTKSASSTAQRFKGVTYHDDHSKYEAKMFRGSREYNLGLFDLASDAALAYDAAYRITGSGTITNDVEEIKYALNWLDHPSASSSTAMKDEGAFNFTAPSQYRSAREKELAEYKSGKVSHPGLDPKAVPSEEELKVRIKKEILNLAKAYVAQQGMPESSNESQQANTEQVGGSAGDENGVVDESVISDLKDTKFKRKKKKFGPKKSWVPEEAESASARSSQTGEETLSTAEQEEEAERREQAEALLFLTKKRNTETKKAGLAVKLEKLMSGSSSRASSNPPQDDDMIMDHAKLAPSVAASAGNPNNIPEGSHAASAAQDEDAKIRQLQLQHQLLQQQQALVSLRAAGGAPAGMLPHGAGALSQLAGGGGNGTAAAANGGGMPMSNNPALEQLMALAAQRPDMVNENVLRHAIQEQQAREAMALREAQLQAAFMANRGLVPGEQQQQQLHGQLPSLSAQLGLAQAQATPVPGKSEESTSAEKKPQAAPSPNESSSNRPTETSMEHDESSEASVAVLLASMGHRGPIPPGLAESLQAAMNERQNENGQHNPTNIGAQEGEENNVIDPQELMRRQLANEAKKAALAQKLSSFMGGPQVPGLNGDLHQELMSNVEQHAQAAQETQLSRKASEDRSQFGSQSQDSQGMTPEDVASAATAETTLQQRLQALQALQGLSSDRMMSGGGGGGGIDEHAMFEQLMLKKQKDEMNKQALEQKVQDYIQGRGIPQPSPAPSSMMNGELSRNLALQQLLQENGVRQGLQNSDLVRQAAIQTLLANQQRGAAGAGQMGLGADQSPLAGGGLSDALTHDVVHRRIVIESMLMSEENRLRQLRESLQSQFVSHPQLGGGGGGAFGGGGNGGGGGGFNPHHALMLERERQLMAEEEARKAAILGGGGIGSVMEQHAQELAIRQALALRASQGAAAAAAPGQGQDIISPEALIEAARAHGVDPQTMLQLLRQG